MTTLIVYSAIGAFVALSVRLLTMESRGNDD